MEASPESDKPVEGAESRAKAYRRCYIGLVLAALIYGAPLLLNLDNFGRRDWDQFSFRYESARIALLRDHQLPLWNPYVNGGNVLLAHPHCPAMSPWFSIVMALGAPVGLRVQVILFMMIGTTGMACLLRRFGVSAFGGFLGGMILMMSSHFALHIAEGHMEWCVLGLMPWLMVLLLKMDKLGRYVVGGALLLASVLTFGSVYIPALFLPFFSFWVVLEAIRRRNWRLMAGWAGVVVLMAMLCAIKLIPQLEFSSGGPPRDAPAAGFSPRGLATVFFDPAQVEYYRSTRITRLPIPEGLGFFKKVSDSEAVATTDMLARRGFGYETDWHEFGCYPTILGMLLALCGMVVSWKRNWPIFVSAALCLNTMLGNGSFIDTWALMQKLPLYGSLSAPSRFACVIIFVLAIAAGFGLDWILGFVKRSRKKLLPLGLAVGIPAVILAELLVMGWSLFGDIFVCERALLEKEGQSFAKHGEFAMRVGRARTLFPIMSSSMMPYLLGNSGMLDEYENVKIPRGRVRTEWAQGYRGEAYLERSAQPVRTTDWTMSRVSLGVNVGSPDRLVINRNFAEGWWATVRGGGGVRTVVAMPNSDFLVSVLLQPGDEEVTFFYRPKSVTRGLWISVVSLGGCFLYLWRGRRREEAQPASEP